VDAVGVAVATAVGAVAGWFAGPVADAVAGPRYGPDAEAHDPEDHALAPLEAPTTTTARVVLAGVGAVAGGLLARPFADGEVVVLLGVLGFAYLVAMTVDLQYLRLPNVCTYPAAGIALLGTLVLSDRLDAPWSPAVVGSVAYAAFLLVARAAFALVRGAEGMGLGDVKLSVSLGATLGWVGGVIDPVNPVLGAIRLVVLSALLANVLGALIGLVLVRRLDRAFPFGPYLVAGWIAILALSEQLAP
jgi:leader peptidase (prepilin peptidase) / N-methyltransferase